MKKHFSFIPGSCSKFLWLAMRTTIFLLLLSTFQLFAAHDYAQEKQLSLNLEDVPLKVALKQIEQQSRFYFMYNDAQVDVQQKVSVDLDARTIHQVLSRLLADRGIAYQVMDKQIVLKPDRHDRPAMINQQGNPITGVVTDEQGNPLPGVNITIKGTTRGVITDVEGNYRIEVEGGDQVLVFSFVGYQKQEIPVKGRDTLNVTLEKKMEKLEEVVVIGYGSSSKKLLTSSVASVQAEDLENSISSGIESALQGRTSGVNINQNSGTPGAAATINIRGISSISAGTQPLYVVDGIPVNSGNYSQISMEGQDISAISNLNPNNIKSISILKDASAAAIYGARAGNGVVLIETKTGSQGETQFNFQSYYGIQEIYEKLDVLNAREWKDYIVNFEGVSDNFGGLHPNLRKEWFEQDNHTDWLDQVFRRAPVQNYELSASGAKDKTTFFVSGRYFKQKGTVLGTDYDKFNGRVNVDYHVSDQLNLGAKITTTYSVNQRVRGDQSVNGPLPNAVSAPPVAPVKDSLGNYPLAGWWDNPVAIGREVVNTAETFHTISNLYGQYNILPQLKLKNQWGFDYYNLQERRFEPSFVKSAKESNGYGADGSSNVFKITQQTTLNYIAEFGEKHNLNVLLGYSFEKWSEKYLFMSGTQFPNNQLRYLESAAVIDQEDTQSEYFESGLTSWFGRVKYNYDNKYLLTLTLRRDGSSNFGKNNRYAYLPSASLAWRAGEEDFMASLPFVSELKLKASYGLTGNDDIGAFGSLNLYSSGYNYYGRSGIIPTQIPNPDLKWETTANYNVGIDLGLFDNRILLTGDVYYNHTTDLLLARPVPPNSGFTSMDANVGELENRGLELELTTDNLTGKIKWSSSFNISFNRNKVLSLYNDQPLTPDNRGNNAVLVGEPIGVFYMYESQGVDPSTGQLVIEDVNQDGTISDADRQVVGSPHPDFTGGLSNKLNYGAFSLDFFFQFTYGNEIFNGVRQYAENMTIINDNQLTTVKDRWQQPGDETYVPRLNGRYNNEITSHYIEDGSYLRLKNLTFSYQLPVNKMKGLDFIDHFRIYVRGQNLWTLTPYSGMDPEVNYAGVSNITRGVDFFTYPQVRTYSVGINMKF